MVHLVAFTIEIILQRTALWTSKEIAYDSFVQGPWGKCAFWVQGIDGIVVLKWIINNSCGGISGAEVMLGLLRCEAMSAVGVFPDILKEQSRQCEGHDRSVSRPRKPESSQTPLWELDILQNWGVLGYGPPVGLQKLCDEMFGCMM